MNYPNAIGKPQTQVGVFPGVAPVKAEVNTKFGSLQVAKPSAPRRLLDKLLTGLHLRGHTQAVLAPPPKRREGPVLLPLIKVSVNHAKQLATIGSNHANAPEARSMLAEKLSGVLEQVRSGAATADLSPEMKSALTRGDRPAFVALLKRALLNETERPRQDEVSQVLDLHLASIVDQYIQDHGPLVASAPGSLSSDKPALLQDKNGHPIVRLQALGVPKDAMEPMLKTLREIGDALYYGQNDQADKLLETWMDGLRPILEQQPKAVQLAFAQGDGKSFIADLRDAVLGQVHGELERGQVTVQLDQFMAQSLNDAFQHLVKNLPGAQNVKAVLPRMPDSANVAVLALERLGRAARAHAEIEAEVAVNEGVAPKAVRMEAALREMQAATGDLLRLVREGAASLALNQAMTQALTTGKMDVFVSALREHVLGGVPAELRNATAWAFDRAAVPASQTDLENHGELKAVPITGPSLVPKTTFDSHLLPTARLDGLAATPQQRVQIEAALGRVAQAMAHGDPTVIREQLGRLAKLLQPIVAQQDDALQLAFTLSNGEAFIGDLAHAILSQAPASQRELVGTQLDLFMRPYLLEAFDQIAMQLDQADDKDDPLLPRQTLQLQGRSYQRDARQAMASGNFGEVWSYTNPNDPKDRVVMKVPKPGTHAPGSAAARKVLVDDPLREGLATLVAMGTGGGDTHNAKLLGALRGPEGVNLVFRFEGGGTLQSKIGLLNGLDTTPALARGKLGLLQDLVGALRRLHESKGVVHLDIALRNVLLDNKGRAVLADLGLSKLLPEGGSIEGAQTPMHADAMPIRWMSPEALRYQPVGEKSEVFNLGVAFIELAFGLGQGNAPWSNFKSNIDIFNLRANGQWDADAMVQALGNLDPKAWPDPTMRQELLALITRMIDTDPTQRPTLAEVAALPLFKGISDADREALQKVLDPPPQGPVLAADEGYTEVIQMGSPPVNDDDVGEILYSEPSAPDEPQQP